MKTSIKSDFLSLIKNDKQALSDSYDISRKTIEITRATKAAMGYSSTGRVVSNSTASVKFKKK